MTAYECMPHHKPGSPLSGSDPARLRVHHAVFAPAGPRRPPCCPLLARHVQGSEKTASSCLSLPGHLMASLHSVARRLGPLAWLARAASISQGHCASAGSGGLGYLQGSACRRASRRISRLTLMEVVDNVVFNIKAITASQLQRLMHTNASWPGPQAGRSSCYGTFFVLGIVLVW